MFESTQLPTFMAWRTSHAAFQGATLPAVLLCHHPELTKTRHKPPFASINPTAPNNPSSNKPDYALKPTQT